MKVLCLIRHAKASHQLDVYKDYDRPLVDKGIAQAQLMATLLQQRKIPFEHIVTSPALRALQTAKLFAQQLELPATKIHSDKSIYMADARELLKTIHAFNNTWQYVIVCGHNPTFTELANSLSKSSIDDLPTSGCYCIEFDTDHWNKIARTNSKLLFCDYPHLHEGL